MVLPPVTEPSRFGLRAWFDPAHHEHSSMQAQLFDGETLLVESQLGEDFSLTLEMDELPKSEQLRVKYLFYERSVRKV